MNAVRGALAFALLATLAQSNFGQLDPGNQPLQDVSLFELREKSTAYNNCRVRVRGEYPLWRSGIGIRDSKTGNILVSTRLEFADDGVVKESRPFQITDFLRLVRSGELEHNLDKIPWLIPLPLKSVPADQLEAVHKLWKRKDNKTVEVVVVGRFDYTGNGGRLIMHRDGHTYWTGGFGPQPQSGDRIVVESIVIHKKTRRGLLR